MWGINKSLPSNRYYIVMRGGNTPILDVTTRIMNEHPMPRWFRWDYYEVVVR